MKNYLLVAGGIIIGLGVASVISKEEDKSGSLFKLIGGTAVVLIAVYGLKKTRIKKIIK